MNKSHIIRTNDCLKRNNLCACEDMFLLYSCSKEKMEVTKLEVNIQNKRIVMVKMKQKNLDFRFQSEKNHDCMCMLV